MCAFAYQSCASGTCVIAGPAASSIISVGAEAASTAKKNSGPRPIHAVPSFRSLASKLASMAARSSGLCDLASSINSGAVRFCAAAFIPARIPTKTSKEIFMPPILPYSRNPIPLRCLYTGIMIRVLRPIPVEQIKLIVFDLDGTLIDSARDLCNSVNAALGHMGRPHLPDEIIASFVGNGAPMLVRRSLAVENGVAPDEVHDEELATAYNFFLAHYRKHKLDFTYAYDGVLESIAGL